MSEKGKSDADREDGDSDVTEAGPADHGNDGGMATRENAPEIAEGAGEESGDRTE